MDRVTVSSQVQSACCGFASALAVDAKLHILLSQLGWIKLLITVLETAIGDATVCRVGPQSAKRQRLYLQFGM